MNPESPIFTIVMPAFGMGEFIGQALKSVGSQSLADWELIVVDDCGPEDGTVAAVQAFAQSHADRRIEFIRQRENGGVSRTRNTAIKSSRGEFLAFLDPDDWWEPEYLARQREAFNRWPEAGVVFSGTLMVDVEGRPLKEWSPPEDYLQNWPRNLYRRNFINPTMAVVRAEVVKRMGGFDTAPEIQHVEDWDLWIRLALEGVVFRRSDAPLVNYRQHGGAATSDGTKFRIREEAIHRKYLSDLLMGEVVLDRLRDAEQQRDRLEEEYRGMVTSHHRRPSVRFRCWLKSLIRR